jgi:hypothetical protein
MVQCANEHDNLGGLSLCKVCGLPLFDLRAEFVTLSEFLVSRAPMGRPLPRTLLIGLGTTGAGLVDIAKAADTVSLPEHTYLAIDGNGTGTHIQSGDSLRLTLGGSMPSAGTFCGLGEVLVRDDPSLFTVMRKAGLSRLDSGQTVYLLAAIGGGIGSAASVIWEKCRQLNPACYVVGLVIVPGTDESFHNRLNAYYCLSRLLGMGADRAADLIVAVHYDRMRKLRGVGADGVELRTEGLLVALSDLLIKNLSSQRIAEVVRINRSMGVTVVVPCLALGRSLEIFGSLKNVLESAITFPANNLYKQAVVVCHLLLRVSETQAGNFGEDRVSEELSQLVKRYLPSVRSTSVSITYSQEQHDRVDVCLLLGGDSAINSLFADETTTGSFQEELARQTSWQTYGLNEKDIQQASCTLAQYDFALKQARSERKQKGCETKNSTAEFTGGVAKGQLNQSYGLMDTAAGDVPSLSSLRASKTRILGNKKSSGSSRTSGHETSGKIGKKGGRDNENSAVRLPKKRTAPETSKNLN